MSDENNECPFCGPLARMLRITVCNRISKNNQLKKKACVETARRFEEGDLSFDELLSIFTNDFDVPEEELKRMLRRDLNLDEEGEEEED